MAESRERVAAAAGLCSGDARVLTYLNRGIRRLLPKGKWVGTVAHYRICVSGNCITWPRAIQTIEMAAVNRWPIKVRNEWFEYLEGGPGIESNEGGLKLVDRGGEHCTFADITAGATDRKIRVYADLAEGAATICLQGYDENANWIRTSYLGSMINGERVSIPTNPAVPVLTTNYFSRLTRVIKDETDGTVRLYEYNTTTSANVRALAFYEHDEKLPSYRRSFVPSLANQHSGGDCEESTVQVAAKLRYYDVAEEDDFLLIGNLSALEEETRALVHYDNRNLQEAAICEGMAVKYLQEELAEYLGDGPVVQMRVERSNFGAGEIENCV